MNSIDLAVENPVVNALYESPSTRVDFFLVGPSKYVRKTIRGLFARELCTHEFLALEKLKGLNGVQQLVEQDSDVSFVSKYVEGESLKFSKNIPDRYFDNLRIVLESVHERGIADLDFAHAKDLIVGLDGQPTVIDLAASIIYHQDSKMAPLVKPIFEYVCSLNRKYLLNRQAMFAPHTLTKAQLKEAENIGTLPKVYRKIRRTLRGQ